MAKNNTKPEPVRCIDCARAEIHQRGRNPLIAWCCGNTNKRNVASTPFICSLFEARKTPITDNEIIHHIQ